MTLPANRTAYTIEQAAERVGRNQRTIKRWLSGGLSHRKIGSRVYIGHGDLLSWWRRRLDNNPTKTRRTD